MRKHLQARCHALEPDVALGRTLLLGQQGEAIGVNRIDPNAAAFAEKMELNRQKYPPEKVQGRAV